MRNAPTQRSAAAPRTPGPWKPPYSEIRSAYVVVSQSCLRNVAWIRADSDQSRLGEAEANAHVIANAPHLIQVLEGIVRQHVSNRRGGEDQQRNERAE